MIYPSNEQQLDFLQHGVSSSPLFANSNGLAVSALDEMLLVNLFSWISKCDEYRDC